MQKDNFIHTDLKEVCNSAAKKLAVLALVAAVGGTAIGSSNCRFTVFAQTGNKTDGSDTQPEENNNNAVQPTQLNNVEDSTIQSTTRDYDDDDDDDDDDYNGDDKKDARSGREETRTDSDTSVSPDGSVKFIGRSGTMYWLTKTYVGARMVRKCSSEPGYSGLFIFILDCQPIPKHAQPLISRAILFIKRALQLSRMDLAERLNLLSIIYCFATRSPYNTALCESIEQDLSYIMGLIDRGRINVPVAPDVDLYSTYMQGDQLYVTDSLEINADIDADHPRDVPTLSSSAPVDVIPGADTEAEQSAQADEAVDNGNSPSTSANNITLAPGVTLHLPNSTTFEVGANASATAENLLRSLSQDSRNSVLSVFGVLSSEK